MTQIRPQILVCSQPFGHWDIFMTRQTLWADSQSPQDLGLSLMQWNNFKDHTGVFACCNPCSAKHIAYAVHPHRSFSKACHLDINLGIYMDVFCTVLAATGFSSHQYGVKTNLSQWTCGNLYFCLSQSDCCVVMQFQNCRFKGGAFRWWWEAPISDSWE